jgi:hypothetical protein
MIAVIGRHRSGGGRSASQSISVRRNACAWRKADASRPDARYGRSMAANPGSVSVPPWFNTQYTPDKGRGTIRVFRLAVMRPHNPSGCHCPLEPMTSRLRRPGNAYAFYD